MRQHVRRYLRLMCAVGMAIPAALAVASPAHAVPVTGILSVNLTDYTGARLVGASVQASTDGVSWTGLEDHLDGGYDAVLLAGSYKIWVVAPGGLRQYAPGKTAIADATAYAVQVGQTTTVDEKLLPSGNVTISLVDRVSGTPVSKGCLSLSGASGDFCDQADGRSEYVGVPLGTHQVSVSGTKTEWPVRTSITVAAGPSQVTIPLDPAAAIQTTVQAAADPSTHPDACVRVVYPGADEALNRVCASLDGSLLIGPLPAAPVQLFVEPSTTLAGAQYGAQWVGPNGGTGDQRRALTVNTTLGTVSVVPPIRLDFSGSISGHISDDFPAPPGGSPPEVFVKPFGQQDGMRTIPAGAGSGLAVDTNSRGAYTLTGLGPYTWPVEFTTRLGLLADEWSGDAPDRFSATPVQVQAGVSSTLNVSLTQHTGSVSGTVKVATGSPSPGGFNLTARNAVTGDDVATGWVDAGSTAFRLAGLNSDPVLLGVWDASGRRCRAQTRTPTSGPGSTGIVLTLPSPTACGQLVPPRTLPPSLTSRPSAVANPSAGRIDVAGDANGTLALRSATSAGVWSDWATLGDGITGTPAVFYNPRFGTTEVYARTTANHLAYRYRAGSGDWSAWTDLGGNVGDDPSVMYNPRFGTTEVYVRTTANHLAYRYWNSGWSDWIDLGGAIAAKPSLMYNPRFGTTEVYVRTTANHLAYRYWNSGWSDWIDLAGDVAGVPAAMYNPRYGTTEVYVRTSGNHVAYRYWNSGWSAWNDLGGGATGDPVLLFNPNSQSTEIYVSYGDHVAEKYWTSQWSDWNNLGGNPSAGIAVAYDPSTTNTGIYLTSPGGYLYQKYWDAKLRVWSTWTNLSP